MKMRKLFVMMLVMAAAITASAADVDQVLKDLKTRIAPDGRVAIWKVTSSIDGDLAVIDGTVGYQDQLDAINAELDKLNISYRNNVKVLANDVPADKQWALVKLSIATLRCEPKHSAEVATQGIMGMPLRVIEVGEWCRVQCPDNYIAYVPESSLNSLLPSLREMRQ